MSLVLPGSTEDDLQVVAAFSGNEITDAERAAGVAGDGEPVPGGLGLWEPTTNLCTNGSFETDLAGWGANNSATLTRDATTSKFGSASQKVVTGNLGAFEGTGFAASVTATDTYTFSFWAKGAGTVEIIIAQIGGVNKTGSAFTVAGAWTRYSFTFTVDAGISQADCIMATTTQQSVTFWIDGAQIEKTPFATPFAGDGATRNAARAQAPATLLNATQCAVAFRVAYGFPSTATRTNPCYLLDWRDDANNLLGLWLDTANKWNAGREAGGAGSPAVSAAQTFATDDKATVIFACDSGHVKVSVNGGAFTSVANTSIPTLAATLADLGSQAATSQLDGRVLWAAVFTGTLSDADAAALNSLPDVMPALFPPATSGLTGQWMAWRPVGPRFRRVHVGSPSVG